MEPNIALIPDPIDGGLYRNESEAIEMPFTP